MTKATHRVEMYREKSKRIDVQWYFHVICRRNGKVVVMGGGYNSYAIAKAAAKALIRALRRPVEMGRGGNLY